MLLAVVMLLAIPSVGQATTPAPGAVTWEPVVDAVR